MFTKRTLTTIALALVLAGPVAAEQTYQGPDRNARISVQPVPAPVPIPPYVEPIQVSVWADRSSYWVGEDVRISFRVDRDAYLYLFSTDASGVTRQIFPNPWDTGNWVQAGRTYRLPDGAYRFVADGPAGWETLTAVATTERHPWMASGYGPSRRSSEPFPVIEGGPQAFTQRLEAQTEADYEAFERSARISPAPVTPGPRAIVVLPAPEPCWQAPGYGVGYATLQVRGPVAYPVPYPAPHIQDFGTLRVRTSPSRVKAYLDGRFIGYTPFELDLPEGSYDLELERGGYETWYQRVRIHDDRTTTIRTYLDRD